MTDKSIKEIHEQIQQAEVAFDSCRERLNATFIWDREAYPKAEDFIKYQEQFREATIREMDNLRAQYRMLDRALSTGEPPKL